MLTLQNLEITHILPKKEGIFAYAKYPKWWNEFKFFIKPDGKVMGETHETWMELTSELGGFIKAKVQNILIEKTNLIYV